MKTNWREALLPAKPQFKNWVMSCWWGWEGEKRVIRVEKRMKLSFSKMCASFSETEFHSAPTSQRTPSGTACFSRNRTLFNKHILAKSPKVFFFSLNGVKLFLNLKEYDPEGNLACPVMACTSRENTKCSTFASCWPSQREFMTHLVVKFFEHRSLEWKNK